VTKYINNGEKPDTRRPVLIDEKHIEAVVNRILRDRGGIAADVLPAAVPVGKDEQPLYKDTNIDFDDAVEILGADGINTITGALDMFRKK